ncbi:hypothetical protein BFC17_10620 [Alteromonas lipolytica]|uniref:Uncharacterized protein n=2 Tax=Alteromonas lipolytica TaxID=1856405 RepID=A0A1E8FIG8_9ALTE|nr:hypothetical protein BFC17_10620 [Alteromonas lipolytica]
MKKLAAKVILLMLVLALVVATITTFTLCGGTLLQNWNGSGGCTNHQLQFNGFATFSMVSQDGAGVALLVIVLVGLLMHVYLQRVRAKKRLNRET